MIQNEYRDLASHGLRLNSREHLETTLPVRTPSHSNDNNETAGRKD